MECHRSVVTGTQFVFHITEGGVWDSLICSSDLDAVIFNEGREMHCIWRSGRLIQCAFGENQNCELISIADGTCISAWPPPLLYDCNLNFFFVCLFVWQI